MFISAEMENREREITAMEKGKKVRLEFHARRDAALVVLDRLNHELDGNVERLTNKDLEVPLFSGGRVCFHQRWATWQIKELYISSLLATEETVLGACWGTEELGWNGRSRKKLRDVRQQSNGFENYEL